MDIHSFNFLLSDAANWSALVPLLIFFLPSKKDNKLDQILLISIVICGVLIDLVLGHLDLFFETDFEYGGTVFYNLYTFLSGIFFFILFRRFAFNQKFKWTSSIAFGANVLFIIFLCIKEGRLDIKNGGIHIILSFLVLFFVLYYFFWRFNNIGDVLITKDPVFWIFTSFFIYFGIPFVITISQDYMDEIDPIVALYVWPIMMISTFIFHLLIAKTIWVMKKA